MNPEGTPIRRVGTHFKIGISNLPRCLCPQKYIPCLRVCRLQEQQIQPQDSNFQLCVFAVTAQIWRPTPTPAPRPLAFITKIKQRSQHTCGNEYWSGSRKRQYQSMWFKHATIAAYLAFYLLSIVVDFRAHALCSFCRILLYLSVHRRTVLVVTQLRCASWEGKGVGG